MGDGLGHCRNLAEDGVEGAETGDDSVGLDRDGRSLRLGVRGNRAAQGEPWPLQRLWRRGCGRRGCPQATPMGGEEDRLDGERAQDIWDKGRAEATEDELKVEKLGGRASFGGLRR